MNMASFELEICSSIKDLSIFKKLLTESSSKHTTGDGYGLGNEIQWNFIGEYVNLCRRAVALMTEKERKLHQCNLEMNSSSGVKLLTDSRAGSNSKKVVKLQASRSGGEVHSSSCKGKGVLQPPEVEQLSDRLTILEEETETMKQDISWAMEERSKLMNEIYQQFEVIHHCLCLRNQVTGETSSDDTMIVSSPKDGKMGTGLSEIFPQEPNLALVTRELRAKMLGSKEE